MSLSEIPTTRTHPRLEALRAKHAALSEEVEDAQKGLAPTNFYLNQLKKQKLVVKQRLAEEERRIAG